MLRIGVIGWGLRRSLARLAHSPERGHVIAALADPSVERQQMFLSEFPEAVAYANYRDLLQADLDAVLILSPDDLHEEHACFLLATGIPVYLEKPMAITVQGCDHILATARESKTKLYVGHNMRHFPIVRKMKEWIDEGRIGDVKAAWCRHFVSYGGEAYYKDWHADRSKTGGLLLQKGAHDIDILHWLAGGYSKTVTAMGKLAVYGDIQDRRTTTEPIPITFTDAWPPSTLTGLYPTVDVEDLNMMLMELDNGVLASYQHCMFTPDAWRNYTIIGTEGRIENFGDIPGNAQVKLWNTRKNGYRADADDVCEFPPEEGHHGGADHHTLAEFFAYLKENRPTDTTPLAARMSVAAGLAATESLRNGSIPMNVK